MATEIPAEITAWIKENYPSILGNTALMVELYETKVNKRNVLSEKKPLSRIADLKVGVYATIKFLKIVERFRRVTPVCKKCNKKACGCNEGMSEITTVMYHGGDDSGLIDAVLFVKPEQYDTLKLFDEADFLLFDGILKEGRDGNPPVFNVSGDKAWALSKEFVNNMEMMETWFSIHRDNGRVDAAAFDEFCKVKNISSEFLTKYSSVLLFRKENNYYRC